MCYVAVNYDVLDSDQLAVSVFRGVAHAAASYSRRSRARIGFWHSPPVTTASSFLPAEMVMPIFFSVKVTWKFFGLSSPPKLSLSLSNKPMSPLTVTVFISGSVGGTGKKIKRKRGGNQGGSANNNSATYPRYHFSTTCPQSARARNSTPPSRRERQQRCVRVELVGLSGTLPGSRVVCSETKKPARDSV